MEDSKVKDTENNTQKDGLSDISKKTNDVVLHQVKEETFFALKTEKLANVLYMMTGLLPETEPLKWKLRGLALELVTALQSFAAGNTVSFQLQLQKVVATVRPILSYLQIARTSGYVSDMNYKLLEQEFRTLQKFVEERDAGSGSSLQAELGPSFANAPLRNSVVSEVKPLERHSIVPSPVASVSAPISQTRTEIIKDITTEAIVIDKGQPQQEAVAQALPVEQGMGRRETILNAIKGKSEYTIKDIAQYISGTSEKTIQRDLQALVAAGVLRRKGERRWSRYFRP